MPSFFDTLPDYGSAPAPQAAPSGSFYGSLPGYSGQNVAIPPQQSVPQQPGFLSRIGNEVLDAAKAGGSTILNAVNPYSDQNTSYINDQMARAKGPAPFDISGSISGLMHAGGMLGNIAGGAAGIAGAPLAPVISRGGAAYDAVTPSFTPQQTATMAKSGVTLPSGAEVMTKALLAARPGNTSPMGMIEKPTIPTAADVKGAATAVYNDPAIRSKTVQPFELNNAVKQATSAPEFSGFHPTDQPGVFRVLDDIQQAASGRLPNGKIGPRPTVGDIDQWSSRLGNLAGETQMTAAGPAPTPQAAAAMQVKSKLDDLLSTAAPGWKEADANYSAFKAAQTLDKKSLQAQNKADGGNGDYAARLRTAATQLLSNPRNTAGWSPENIAQLKSIQQGTATQSALNAFGKMLGGAKHGLGTVVGGLIGFSHGGEFGAAAGAGAGAVADAAIGKGLMASRNALANRQVDNLLSSVLQGSPYGRSLPPTPVSPPNPIFSGMQLSQLPQMSPLMLRQLLGVMPAPANQQN